MRVAITGASNFVNRMFEACGPYQWAREFLKNSLEAKATKVEFGLEWQAVEKHGVYRRTIVDNGIGMTSEDLLRFFSTLGAGAKKIGGVHENFGVGAKIASLPWNPEGVVIISYMGGKSSMIRIALEPDSGEYELFEYKIGGGTSCVIDPSEIEWEAAGDIDWSLVAPSWARDHGTVIVLLGSEEQPDTVLGNPGAGEAEAYIKGLSVYLNSRFWDLSGLEVKVVELRSEKKNSWPTGPGDRDDARRPNNRTIMGAKYYLTDVKGPKGKLADSGILLVDEERVVVEWYLWQGERPYVHSYAKRPGYIAIRYGDELYQVTSGKVQFRAFGAIEGEVQQNLSIILEPQHYDPRDARWGVHPDQSRNRLLFTGNGEKGGEPPLFEWGREFAERMPEVVLQAVQAARGEGGGTIEDQEYRKRLQDKFGKRWTIKSLVKPIRKPRSPIPVTVTDSETEASGELTPNPDGNRAKRKGKKTVMVLRQKATPGGAEEGVEAETPVDVPRYRFGHKDEFEVPWHLALWAPNDTDGPTVVLNVDSPLLEESVKYHQDQYPDIYAEEVAKVVRSTFGEVAACKIAHSQKLTREVPEEELDRDYRSESALTIALMGLLAEESLISQRLGRLGKKKTAA